MKTELQTEVMEIMAQLPEDAELEDLIYALRLREYLQKSTDDLEAGRVWTTEQLQERFRHVQKAVEAGEADADAGRVYTSDEIRAEFKTISKLEPE
jgi:hypothetical protein